MKPNNERYFSTADKTFMQLCDEVDYWKERAEDYKERYEELNKEYCQFINDGIKNGQEMIGNVLSVMLRIEDTEQGTLIRKDND